MVSVGAVSRIDTVYPVVGAPNVRRSQPTESQSNITTALVSEYYQLRELLNPSSAYYIFNEVERHKIGDVISRLILRFNSAVESGDINPTEYWDLLSQAVSLAEGNKQESAYALAGENLAMQRALQDVETLTAYSDALEERLMEGLAHQRELQLSLF